MNFIYDVLVNFQNELYDFYDWNTDDVIEHIKKIPLINISTKDLKSICDDKVELKKEFLNLIFEKTILFNARSTPIEYACLLTDNELVIAIKLDNGILKKSRISIFEELDVLENSNDIKYSIVEKVALRSKLSSNLIRSDQNIKKSIIKGIKILKNNDVEKLRYLYYECFNKKEKDEDIIINQIIETIESDFDKVAYKIYDFLKITQV